VETPLCYVNRAPFATAISEIHMLVPNRQGLKKVRGKVLCIERVRCTMHPHDLRLCRFMVMHFQ
jgi:hypothetical protein